ncbi:SWIB-domain-containing protein [Tilletiaria anomala UBC 951]|uniref:SWIB-domain-containing protein n=1 Tax=Tilletiaria anomala (strain ATCC 24038 / CBS 436.72 / UBC 951) TaxID=1037660 RepID=A0A066VAX7_TILAU|nr:SWIB-domain-containing protein [Tilletiaria anomala UBC 951]KDN38636.1 SWIB-domain-containing protein [Tilletiaria anomala UBC 951]
MDVTALRPSVVSILRQSDLNKISAKAVRLKLIQDPIYSVQIPAGADLNGRDKEAINELIKECFESINDEVNRSRHAGGIALPGTGGVPGGLPQGYPAHNAPAPASNTAVAASSSKKKRSKAQVNDEIDSDEDAGVSKKKAKKRKTTGEKTKRAANPNNPFNMPLILDAVLADVCGVEELARPQIVKKIWEHIKGNQLQDPQNGRRILCDAKLKKLFGKDDIDSFEMAKHISAHVTKKPAAPAATPAEG